MSRLRSTMTGAAWSEKRDAFANARATLRGGATESAWERRSDVGSNDYLLGRLLRLHLFLAVAWSDSGRRIQHPTVLDDLSDLGAVERLKLEQGLGDGIECVSVGRKHSLSRCVSVIE